MPKNSLLTSNQSSAIIAPASVKIGRMTNKERGDFIRNECKELCTKLAALEPYVREAFTRLEARKTICGYTSKPASCENVLGRTYNAVKFMLAGGNPRDAKQNNHRNCSNNYNLGNPEDGNHYWLTPPDLLEQIHQEFGELTDPCPHPHPEGYDGLTAEWVRPIMLIRHLAASGTTAKRLA